jgi:hypothetical protein
MSWRITQLGDQPCDQDKLILNLFSNKTVNYVGPDIDFRLWLNHDIESENLILILNSPLWVSDVITTLQTHLTNRVQTFYIGINRYQILGNDTDIVDTGIDNFSTNLINFITKS